MNKTAIIGDYEVRLSNFFGNEEHLCLDIGYNDIEEHSMDTYIEMLLKRKDIEQLVNFLKSCLLTE